MKEKIPKPIRPVLRKGKHWLVRSGRFIARPWRHHWDINCFNKYVIQKYRRHIRGAIQVGAHYGLEYPHFKGIERLLFFEPLPHVFEEMKKNVGPEVITENLALGNDENEVEMHVESANNGQSSSILKPKDHLTLYPDIVFNRKIKVKQTTLDKYLSLRGWQGEFNFLEIDVQGYEMEVLKGAKQTLSDIDFIYIEISKVALYDQGCYVNDIDAFLSELGFFRKKTVWTPYGWGDALYKKSRT